jgi:hypothetical protein
MTASWIAFCRRPRWMLDRVLTGELSAHAAMIDAGFRKPRVAR